MRFAIILWLTLYNYSSAIFNYYEIIGGNVQSVGKDKIYGFKKKPSPLLVVRKGEIFEPAQPIGYIDGRYQFEGDSDNIYYACGVHNRNIFFKLEEIPKNFFCAEELNYNTNDIKEEPQRIKSHGYTITGFWYHDLSNCHISLLTFYEYQYAVKYRLRARYLFDIVNRPALKHGYLKYENSFFEKNLQHFSDPKYNGNEWNFKIFTLAPAENFLTIPEADITFILNNIAPIWNILYQKWLNIEHFIRKVSHVIGELKIFVGWRSTLNVNNSPVHVQNISIFSKNQKAPVPRYYTKAVIHNQSNTAIIIVFDMNMEKDSEKLCDRDISRENGWFISNIDDYGAIYACEFDKTIMTPWEEELPVNYGILNLNTVQFEITENGETFKYDRNVVENILNNFY